MANWHKRSVVAGSSLSLITAFLSRLSYINLINGYFMFGLVQVLLTTFCLVSSVVALHIASLSPAPSLSLSELLGTYIRKYIIIPVLARWKHNQMLRCIQDPQSHQDNLLMNILKENGQTIFAKDHGLDKVKTQADFRNKFPLTDYSVYENYVKRIEKGEKNIMTKADVKYLALSSGCTGKNKMLPYTFYDYGITQLTMLILVNFSLSLIHPRLGRSFILSLFHPSRKSSCGITIGGLWMAFVRRQQHILPACIQKITKEGPIYFVQALIALRDPDITVIMGTGSDLMYAFFKSMELNKDQLCRAIETGHIEPFPHLDDDVRAELNQLLTPDPDRAKEVHLQLTRGSGCLAARLWPDLKHVIVASTGGFAHSANLLKQSYLDNLIVCLGCHGATEGYCGMALSLHDHLNDIYTMIPTLSFLEFIKIEDADKQNPPTYVMSQLDVGQLYELVVTNYMGLYRFRFGDVIKVTGFNSNTPKYAFQYRTGEILNCAYDRTPQNVFYEALKFTEAQWQGVTITSYTSTESMHLEPITGEKYEKNHYVCFVETEESVTLTQQLCDMLDKNLCNMHESYAEFRNQESVGPLSIIQVNRGTFDQLRNVLWGKIPHAQYKTPRVLHRPEALKFLWNNRVS